MKKQVQANPVVTLLCIIILLSWMQYFNLYGRYREAQQKLDQIYYECVYKKAPKQ